MATQMFTAPDGTKWTSQKDLDSYVAGGMRGGPGVNKAMEIGRAQVKAVNQAETLVKNAYGVPVPSRPQPTQAQPQQRQVQQDQTSLSSIPRDTTQAGETSGKVSGIGQGYWDANGYWKAGTPPDTTAKPNLDFLALTQQQRTIKQLEIMGSTEEAKRIANMTPTEYAVYQSNKEKESFEQQKKRTELEQRIQAEQLADQQSKGKRAIEATQSSLAQSPESVGFSTSSQISKQFSDTVNNRLQTARDIYDANQRQITYLQKQQQDAMARNDVVRAEGLAESLANTQANLLKAQQNVEASEQQAYKDSFSLIEGLQGSGLLANMTEDQIQALAPMLGNLPSEIVQPMLQSVYSNMLERRGASEQATKLAKAQGGIKTMLGLVKEGMVLSENSMRQFAEETGLSLEMVLDLNAGAQGVMNDKNLGRTEQMMKIQKLGYQASREAKGVVNEDLEKVDYLMNLYKSGASQEEIAMAKRLMGIDDMDDPMYQAKQEKRYLENKLSYMEGEGDVPYGSKEYWDIQETKAKIGKINSKLSNVYSDTSDSMGLGISWVPGNTGMRTDRHNNPIATKAYPATIKILENAGLKQGIDFFVGDSTAGVDTDSVATIAYKDPQTGIIGSIASLANGQMASWYANPKYKAGYRKTLDVLGDLSGEKVTTPDQAQSVFNNLSAQEQAIVVGEIYKHEGGKGRFEKPVDFGQMATDIDTKLAQTYKEFKKGLVTRASFMNTVLSGVPKEYKEQAQEYLSKKIERGYDSNMGSGSFGVLADALGIPYGRGILEKIPTTQDYDFSQTDAQEKAQSEAKKAKEENMNRTDVAMQNLVENPLVREMYNSAETEDEFTEMMVMEYPSITPEELKNIRVKLQNE